MLANRAKTLLGPLYAPIRMRLAGIADQQQRNAILLGQILAQRGRSGVPLERLNEAEFSVFSQFGEDGVIQHLVSSISVPDRTFVEIGVDNYFESNTRFLLLADKWRGLIVDGSAAQIESVARSELSWRTQLTAVSSFVTRENVNELLERAGVRSDIGLFSLDVDGNDYWIWEALTATRARIVVCEMNPAFGCELPITIPYDPRFVRRTDRGRGVYFGASLAALDAVASKKGYTLVGATSEGVNAFFVRNDVIGSLPRASPRECFAAMTPSRLTGLPDLAPVAELPVVNVVSGETGPIRGLLTELRARPAPGPLPSAL